MKVTAIFILSLGALVAAQENTVTDNPQAPTSTVVPVPTDSSLGGAPGAAQTSGGASVCIPGSPGCTATGLPSDTTTNSAPSSSSSSTDTTTTTSVSFDTGPTVTNMDPPPSSSNNAAPTTTLITAATSTRSQTSAVRSSSSGGGAFAAKPTNAFGPVAVMAGLFAAAMV